MEIVGNCKRCNSDKTTLDINGAVATEIVSGWQQFETFCTCRHCRRSNIFCLRQKTMGVHGIDMLNTGFTKQFNANLNSYFNIMGYVSIKDERASPSPEYLPSNIDLVFKEGTTCLAVQCPNAAGTMFRLCLDLCTQPLLPPTNELGLNSQIRRSLGLRLKWLFEHQKLPEALVDLSECVKDDGNDGAHQGNLELVDAENLMDFTFQILETLYTTPGKLKLAKEKRDARKA